MGEASSTDVHLIGLELLRVTATAVDREEAIAAVRRLTASTGARGVDVTSPARVGRSAEGTSARAGHSTLTADAARGLAALP